MLPKQGKIAALDLGTRRTGFAITDENQRVAFARPEIDHANNNELLKELKDLFNSEKVLGIVVGVPLKLDGTSTAQTEKVEALVEKLDALNLPIQKMDERLTTEFAKDLHGFQSKEKHVDSRSAQILLENYLNQ